MRAMRAFLTVTLFSAPAWAPSWASAGPGEAAAAAAPEAAKPDGEAAKPPPAEAAQPAAQAPAAAPEAPMPAAAPEAPMPAAAPEAPMPAAAAPEPAAKAPAGAKPAASDLGRLVKHIRKTFSVPPDVVLEIKEVRPSPVPNFDLATLHSSFQGRSQSQAVLVSRDRKLYFMTEVFGLKPSRLAGLVATADSQGGRAPQLHVTKDLKHFFVGPPHDATVDPDKQNASRLSLADAPARGPKSAPVTLVEYSDLQCPFCARAHADLEKNLPSTFGGKVRWVFKHYPLTNIHPWAEPAALAVSCAYAQNPDASWKVIDAVFEAQQQLQPGNLRAKVIEAAKAAGLEEARFQACFDNKEAKAVVDAHVQNADSVGVDSTPTFFVNGRKLSGYNGFDSLKAVIEEMLAE